MFTVQDTYFVKALNISTGCIESMPGVDTVTILPVVTPTVTITASPGTHIEVGAYDTLIASESGGGISPIYQWYVDGFLIPGATTSAYITNTLFDGDIVLCSVISSDGCSTTGTDSVLITFSSTGIAVSSVPLKNYLQVYPNPARDILNVAGVPDNTKYWFMSVTGTLLSQGILHNSYNSISLLQYPPGVYILELYSGTEKKNMAQVIKE
jgi:hypothetical protein